MMAAIGVVCALSQLDHQIQKQVLDELQTRFPDLHVEIGSTDLVSAKGISIKMLEISTHDLPGAPAKPLLNIAEMFVECPVTIQSFLNDEITIRRIIIRNPIARLTRNVDGTIDELQYLPSQQHSSLQSCPIEIIGGTLLYEDKRADAPEPIKVTGIDVTFDPPKPESDADVLSDVETRYPTQSNAQTPKMSLWRFKGSAKGDLFRQLQYEGLFDPQTKYWECTGRCRQFDWTSDLFRYLPEYRIPDTFSPTERNQLVKTIESFQGRFDCTFTCSKEIPSDPTSTPNKNIRFTIDGELSQGRAKLFAMDLMLSELNGMFHLSDKGLLVNKLNGLGEAARLLNFSYRQEGWHQGVDAQLYLQVTGVNVNPKLTQALSPVLNDKVEELLRKFDYSATAQIEAEFKRTRNHWHPKSLTLNVTDLALTSLEFPYRVDRLAGQLRLDDSATIQYAFKTPTGEPVWVEILGRYENIFTDEFGHMLIRGTDVPIDAKLLQAIPESYRAVVQSLNPVGKIAASFVIKNPPGDAPSEKEFQIGLDGISVRYDKFPYPLTDTYGLLTFKDGDWIFENIIAKGESTEVACKGHLKRISNEIGKNGFEFFINIGAVELPIDGEIRKALINPNHRELLENLYAKGKVKLDASVLYRSDDNQLNIGFLAQPLAGMSMVPVHFPYRIEDVQGDFLYNNGTMTVKRFRGENRETKISADIVCQLNPNGSWQLDMNELHIDRLQLKKELLEAMPKTLLQIVDELQVQGAINLKGAVRFSKESTVSPLRTIWDIGIVLHQNSAKIGLSLQNIYGNLLLSGISEGERTRVSGELQLTSLTTNGMQLNNVSGPFFYDGDTNLIYLGQKAQAALTPSPEIAYESFHKSGWFTPQPQARRIVGDFFGGKLMIDGHVDHSKGLSYSIHCGVHDASLKEIAQKYEPQAGNIQGRLHSQVHLHGIGKNIDTLGGDGIIQLRDANIYQLTGMMRLLQALRNNINVNTNDSAFSKADVKFKLQGNRAILDYVEFQGNAFSLRGAGVMKLDDRTVRLFMKTRLGNRQAVMPALNEILGVVGDRIIQLSVRGPISDPTISQIALPDLQNLRLQLQGEGATGFDDVLLEPPPISGTR